MTRATALFGSWQDRDVEATDAALKAVAEVARDVSIAVLAAAPDEGIAARLGEGLSGLGWSVVVEQPTLRAVRSQWQG